MSDLETLAFEATRLASITYRLAESMLGRRSIGADGLREYRLNDAQVEDLMFLLGEQADAAAAINREAKQAASVQRYFRFNQSLADKIVIAVEARKTYELISEENVEAKEAAYKAWGDADDEFYREPCLSVCDTIIKLRFVMEDEQMLESLDERFIGNETGEMVFIKSLLPKEGNANG